MPQPGAEAECSPRTTSAQHLEAREPSPLNEMNCQLPLQFVFTIYHLSFIFIVSIYFSKFRQLTTVMILHVFLVSHKNATSNEFNLLDHQKMRPLKFDGWHCVSEYGLHVGIESHSGAAVTCPVVTSGTTVAARTRRQQLQTLDNVKLGSTCYYFLLGSVGSFSVIKQAGQPIHYYTFSKISTPLPELHTPMRFSV